VEWISIEQDGFAMKKTTDENVVKLIFIPLISAVLSFLVFITIYLSRQVSLSYLFGFFYEALAVWIASYVLISGTINMFYTKGDIRKSFDNIIKSPVSWLYLIPPIILLLSFTMRIIFR
jgi:hypothetical protein